jgi:Family of unknown function (DUF5641)
MGRVTKVSPRADGIVRVAEVRTAHDLLKRPVRKQYQGGECVGTTTKKTRTLLFAKITVHLCLHCACRDQVSFGRRNENIKGAIKHRKPNG